MEYTMEEVQPLKDETPESTDDSSTSSNAPQESNSQSTEDAETRSNEPGINNSQTTEESGSNTNPSQESSPQVAEEPGSLAKPPEESSHPLAEETDLISTFIKENYPQIAEDIGSTSNDLQESNLQSQEDTDSMTNSPQESNLQSIEEVDSLSNSEDNNNPSFDDETADNPKPPQESNLQSAEEVGSLSIESNNSHPPSIQEIGSLSIFTEASNSQPLQEVVSISSPQVPAVESDPKKIALILSGGGARGAFQVGAEKYARDVKGYHWDIIAGVSVGAMNGAMLAMHHYTRLMELWDSISDEQVYTGGFNLVSLVKIIFGAKSFYGNAPLQKLMQQEFEAGRVIDDLHVGAVSLISGEYVQFTKESLELPKAILASASIPVVFPPVDVSPDRTAMVDGGVRNLSPVGDVLDLEPDEIVIINCGTEQPAVLPQAPANVLSIGMRTLDIMQNEIFINDMKEFLRINALVREAENQGCFLHHPKTGRLLKYYPCQIIEPDGEMGGVLDFSQSSIQAALKAGVRRAREVLGRP